MRLFYLIQFRFNRRVILLQCFVFRIEIGDCSFVLVSFDRIWFDLLRWLAIVPPKPSYFCCNVLYALCVPDSAHFEAMHSHSMHHFAVTMCAFVASIGLFVVPCPASHGSIPCFVRLIHPFVDDACAVFH
eukprot:771931_1